jgi:hypothetical protein
MGVALVFVLGMAGCGILQEQDVPGELPGGRGKPSYGGEDERVGLFGEGGLNIFGGDSEGEAASGSPIGVNSFLWRASLDTLSFMPLMSADAFGGVIIHDWYTPPESTNERFKVTVYILSRDLRSDGLRVSVFRQHRDGADNWIDGQVSPETNGDLEKAILTRARQLRVNGLAN